MAATYYMWLSFFDSTINVGVRFFVKYLIIIDFYTLLC